jgi:hypothetical protein
VIDIGDRVSTFRDGPGTVVNVMYTDLRTTLHGVFSIDVKEVDVEFDSGVTKFVLPEQLLET